jgi:hypothetical protein
VSASHIERTAISDHANLDILSLLKLPHHHSLLKKPKVSTPVSVVLGGA